MNRTQPLMNTVEKYKEFEHIVQGDTRYSRGIIWTDDQYNNIEKKLTGNQFCNDIIKEIFHDFQFFFRADTAPKDRWDERFQNAAEKLAWMTVWYTSNQMKQRKDNADKKTRLTFEIGRYIYEYILRNKERIIEEAGWKDGPLEEILPFGVSEALESESLRLGIMSDEEHDALGYEIMEDIDEFKFGLDDAKGEIDKMVSMGEATELEGNIARGVVNLLESLVDSMGSLITEAMEEE